MPLGERMNGGPEMQQAAAPGWEHFRHVADIGVRGTGRSLAEAFEQAALAMTAVIVDPGDVAELGEVAIEVSAPDDELLLTEWLNALVYEMATRHMLFARFEVKIRGDSLSATAWGEPIDVARHQPTVEIKGATFTELRVWRSDDGLWHAQCVVDV
jgi:tRNA nucleotidyltransferase (CCA-adding enzyme)